MLTKTQIEDSIQAMQTAVEYNVAALLSASRAGGASVHRVLAQAPSLSYALTSLSQLQDLLVDTEIAEEEAVEVDAGNGEAAIENAFAKRMREAREAAQARKASKKR